MFGLLKNLYKWVNQKQERVLTIVLIGVDGAGKSSVLYSLKGEFPDFIAPTVGFSSEVIVVGKYQMKIYDLGGGPTFRGIWGRYYAEVHAAVFVVDSGDERKIHAAKDALHGALQHPRFQKKPVLVLANKQDLSGAMSTDQIASNLELEKFKDYQFNVIGCTAQRTSTEGVIDPNIKKGLEWLTKTVDSRFKELQTQVDAQTAEQKEEERREREAKRLRVEAMRREREREKELEREREEKEKENSNQNKITIGLSEGTEKKNEIEMPHISSKPVLTEIKITENGVNTEKTGWVSISDMNADQAQSKTESTENATTISLTPRNSGSTTFRNTQQQSVRSLRLEPIVIPASPALEPNPSLSSLVTSASKTDSESGHTLGKRESFYETTPSKFLPNIPLNVSNNPSSPS
eukprot:TRINITY_DN431_c0_g1_i2.p1 TRINITY_DN431_c0_g1~~TRINITY_DN431_c0_g1_i2.p1  ORF type:complete len:406 (-),score=97.27 TRINITY_DN431_c0_g1_i2:146-1363(-)